MTTWKAAQVKKTVLELKDIHTKLKVRLNVGDPPLQIQEAEITKKMKSNNNHIERYNRTVLQIFLNQILQALLINNRRAVRATIEAIMCNQIGGT